MPERLRRRHWERYRQTMETGRTRYAAGELLSVPAIRRDGARISIRFSIVPLREGDGPGGVAAIMRDVTVEFGERKKLRQDLDACRRARISAGGGQTW